MTVRFSTLSFFGAAGPCVLPSAALCSLQNLDDNQITSKTPIKYNRQLQPIDSILFDWGYLFNYWLFWFKFSFSLSLIPSARVWTVFVFSAYVLSYIFLLIDWLWLVNAKSVGIGRRWNFGLPSSPSLSLASVKRPAPIIWVSDLEKKSNSLYSFASSRFAWANFCIELNCQKCHLLKPHWFPCLLDLDCSHYMMNGIGLYLLFQHIFDK